MLSSEITSASSTFQFTFLLLTQFPQLSIRTRKGTHSSCALHLLLHSSLWWRSLDFPLLLCWTSILTPSQISQSYFQQTLEHNVTVPQVSPYESRHTLSKRTFITSSLLPCEKLNNVSFGYNTSTSFGVDQTSVGGHPFGQYCVGPVHVGNQFYSSNNQGIKKTFETIYQLLLTPIF